MKNLKNNIAKTIIILSVVFAFSSCKKDKDTDTESGPNTGSYTYQGKTTNITRADYRSADDGVGIFLAEGTTGNSLYIRFPRTGAYIIPTGTFQYSNLLPNNNLYNPKTHFNGGSVQLQGTLISDPFNGGNVTITKVGNNYTISVDVTTAKGAVKGSYKGKLDKIPEV